MKEGGGGGLGYCVVWPVPSAGALSFIWPAVGQGHVRLLRVGEPNRSFGCDWNVTFTVHHRSITAPSTPQPILAEASHTVIPKPVKLKGGLVMRMCKKAQS